MGGVSINDCLKKFETSGTTSRVSFQGLKKTANLKFNRWNFKANSKKFDIWYDLYLFYRI